MYREGDTIFAVASGAGRAAVTLVRVSGPQSERILSSLCGSMPEPRRASVRALRSGSDLLDRAVVLWLPGPGSYTGEDGAELHLHGGPAVLAAVSAAINVLGGRPAEAGEFSRRAFLNGRMGLTEAEAVADLVAAETEGQRRQALRQMDGALGKLYRGWAERLLLLLAQMEALIDFPDEGLPAATGAANRLALLTLEGEIRAHLDDGRRGELLREGLVFAVVGAPNAGKSSLVNALVQREVAIVAPSVGTTRDVLEVRVAWGGVPVTLLDTAGLRATADAVEAEGVRRAVARSTEADVVLFVRDASAPFECASILEWRGEVIEVETKIDLARPTRIGAVPVSVWSGEGMARLASLLSDTAARLTGLSGPPSLTRSRHRTALTEAADALASAANATMPELVAEDVRIAVRVLGGVTGQVGIDDVLDSVFSQFCIGK